MVRIDPQRLLKKSNRLVRISFPGRQNSQVVPGVWQRSRIIRRRFNGPFEILPLFLPFLLLQVNAAQAVTRLRSAWILLLRQSKKFLRLLQISALIKYRTKRKVVPSNLVSLAHSSEWQSTRHAFRWRFWNLAKIRFHMIQSQLALINLRNAPLRINEEGSRQSHVPVPVKKPPVKKVVHGHQFRRRTDNGKRPPTRRLRPRNIHHDQLQPLAQPSIVLFLKDRKVRLPIGHLRRSEMQEHWPSPARGKQFFLSVRSNNAKIRRGYRHKQPCFHLRRQLLSVVG